MICGMTYDLHTGCRSLPLGTLCDTMRWVCWLFVG